MTTIGLFGGTFDPLHWGHLRPLLALADSLQFDELRLMPSAIPPHKPQPKATAEQRLAMVKLACQLDSRLSCEPWELNQQRPSYTAVTLAELRAANRWSTTTHRLVFIMGSDSFSQLEQWFHWQEIFQHADIAVLPRPHTAELSGVMRRTLADRQCQNFAKTAINGNIYCAKTEILDISSSAIRSAIATAQPWQHWVPANIADFIQTEQFYHT